MKTNSAGFRGANPTKMFTIPRLISFWVVVSLLHFTMYASFGVEPWKAPCLKRFCMNAPTLSLICAQSGSSLGSKTTHCVPR